MSVQAQFESPILNVHVPRVCERTIDDNVRQGHLCRLVNVGLHLLFQGDDLNAVNEQDCSKGAAWQS